MRLFPIILCCAVQAVRGYDGPPPLTEVDGRSPIRMGGELLGGYRSDYIHRGEKMGPNSVEGQISGGASLSDSWAVSGEFFAIRNWQGRNFSQTTPARGTSVLPGGRVYGRTVCQRTVV